MSPTTTVRISRNCKSFGVAFASQLLLLTTHQHEEYSKSTAATIALFAVEMLVVALLFSMAFHRLTLHDGIITLHPKFFGRKK